MVTRPSFTHSATIEVSFIVYPVRDIAASRQFFDTVLRTHGAAISDDWIEYVIGHTTFAITPADADHPTPVRGALVAFEVTDLESEIARLRSHSVAFREKIIETAVCRFIIALDPDGSEFLIHQRKPTSYATQST
jgi:hypothetical protein